MIRHLSGTFLAAEEDGFILQTGGVGYHLVCPPGWNYPPSGSPLEVWVETIWREDSMRLYGFPNNDCRRWFCALIKIPGVGPALALALLGVCPPARLAAAIAEGDVKTLTLAPGLGQKMARRILNEIKDTPADGGAVLAGASGLGEAKEPEASALKALLKLGYSQPAASNALAQIMQQHKTAPPLENLIRAALRMLAS